MVTFCPLARLLSNLDKHIAVVDRLVQKNEWQVVRSNRQE